MLYCHGYTLRMAALEYAAMGVPVFPLVQNSKIPLIPNGFKGASNDPSVINGWWEEWPDANIGIPTGKASGWLVLDVDCKNNVDGWDSLKNMEEGFGKLPVTLSQWTPSGGAHYIFKYPDLEVRNSVGKLASGLDVRAEGGYIVVAPSIIEGNKYALKGDAECPVDTSDYWKKQTIRLSISNIERM